MLAPHMRSMDALRVILALLWLCGIAAVLALLLAGHLRLRTMLRGSRLLADPVAAALTQECRARLRLDFPVTLTENPRVKTPLVLGVIRPTIILPAGLARQLSEAELRGVLLHELAHVKRHDILVSWLINLILALHWFNPLVWLAASRWRVERELACDELVLHALAAPELRPHADQARRARRIASLAGLASLFPGMLPRRLRHHPEQRGPEKDNRHDRSLPSPLARLQHHRPRARRPRPRRGPHQRSAPHTATRSRHSRRSRARRSAHLPLPPKSSDVRLYTHAYKDFVGKDSDGRLMWTLPKDAILEVLREYRGIGDNDQQYLDTRITIVLQDRTNSFWAMIASLETADARLFRDELEKAIPQRIKALEGHGKNAGDAQVAAPRFASSDQASKFGEINPKLPLRPTVSGRSLSKPIMISLTSIPPGTPIKSDLKMELTLAAASSLASNITNELGRRDLALAEKLAADIARPGQAPAEPAPR